MMTLARPAALDMRAASLREIIGQIAMTRKSLESTEKLSNDLPAIDQLDRPTDAAHVFVVGVDSKRRVHRAEKVAHRDRPLRNFLPAGVRFTDDLSATDTAARESNVERPWIMI